MPDKYTKDFRFAIKLDSVKLVSSLLLLFFISCNTTENKTHVEAGIVEPEFPEVLRYALIDEAKSFDNIHADSSKIDFFFGLADRHPSFQTVIYKYIISNTNDSIQNKKHITAYRLLSQTFIKKNNIDSVVYYIQEGIKCCGSDPKFSDQLSELYRDLGNLYSNFSRNAEAISNFDMAIQVASASGNKDNLFRYITETGRVYMGMNELEKAKECYSKGRLYAEKYNNSSLLIYSLNSLGDILRRQEKFKESIQHHQQAIAVHKKNQGADYEQWACTSLGKCFNSLQQYDSAQKYFNISLKLASQQGSIDLETQSYLNLSICDYKQKRLDRAINYGLQAYEVSERTPQLEIKTAVMENLYILYKETGQYEKSIYFLENMKALQDSLENKENFKKFAEAEYKTKEDKLLYRMEQDQLQFKHEQEERELEAKRQNIILVSIAIISILSLAFGVFVFRIFRQLRTKNRIIEEKQKEILQSIKYARRIQNSLLPSEKYIGRILKKLNPD